MALICAKKSYNYPLQFARYFGKCIAGYLRKCRVASFFDDADDDDDDDE